MRRFPVRVYQAAVSIAAVAYFAHAVLRDPERFEHPVLLAWVALLAAISLLPVPAFQARVGMDFPLSMALAVLYAPAVAGLSTLVGSCDTREFRREVPPLRALFNRAQVGLATAAASGVFHPIAGAHPTLAIFLAAAAPAVVVGYCLNIAMVSIAIALDYGIRLREVVADLRIGSLPKFVATFVALGLGGALLAWLYMRVGAWIVGPLVVAVLLARRMYVRTQALEETARQLERSLSQLTLLQDFASKLDRLNDVAHIGHTISDELLDLVASQECRVYLLDADGRMLVPLVSPARDVDADGSIARSLAVAVGDGITGRSVAEDRTIHVPDAGRAEFAVGTPGTPGADESIVAVPMRARGRVLGTIVVVASGPHRFDDSDIQVLEVLASRAAVAIDNAHLIQSEREISERYRVLVEYLPAITYIEAADGSPRYVSPQIEQLTGYTPQERLDDPVSWWARVEEREEILQVREECLRSGRAFLREYRFRRRDGGLVWLRDEAVLVAGPPGGDPFWQGVIVDVTARRDAESRIEFLAFHDKLTELPNRALFEQLLAQALHRAGRDRTAVAVLSLDVDGLKLVNDALGHDAGDELLRQVAASLRAVIRMADVAARVGGDEFAVLVPDLPFEDGPAEAVAAAERVALRVQERLRAPLLLGAREVYASTSIGISVFPVDADEADSLVRNADAAMYQAKRTESGSYMVFSGRTGPMKDTLTLASRLRQAAREQNWLLEYQPIVDLDRGGVVAVEALLRMQRGRGRVVPAGEFIHMAEEMGIMGPVTEWVLATLSRQIPVWRRAGSTIDVTFNLSARQLWDPVLPYVVLAKLAEHGVDPSSVTAEVTESAVMTQIDRAQGVLAALHDGGIRVAIDDFGTGYSSLSRLRELPVDVVKIDRTFVRDLPEDRDARTIVRAMLQLVTSLEIVPLAEGIETEGQLRFLTEHGCVLGQGFLFARPMSAKRVLAFVQEHQRAG